VFAELLRRRLGSLIELSRGQMSQLEKHFELLSRWNEVLNLTSLSTLEEIVERHYCESLFLGMQLPAGELRIADVGSGAGFPGIPIAVLRPECTVALVESHQRKGVFLREATRELENVRVIARRVEHIGQHFDWAVSRAVKFAEVEKPLSTLTRHVALLAGENPPSNSCFTWNKPIAVPWGSRRYLWLGRARST
jgi:16S rRNA (guanine(527)-N(7))-methyltransferase RsmG